MGKNRSLQEDIDIMKALDASVTQIEKDRAAALASVQKRIRGGESTGDPIDDFMLCCAASGPEHQRKQIEEKLRGLQQQLAGKRGELALIVTAQRKLLREGGCFSGPDIQTKAEFRLGCLTDDRLIFDLGKAEWSMPTDGYAVWNSTYRFMPTEGDLKAQKKDGGMYLPTVAALSFYGFDGSWAVEIIVGTETVDARFASQLAHKVLAKMAAAIGFQIDRFPACASHLKDGL